MVNRLWYKGSMADARLTITIRRPLEDVFAVLTDVEKTSTWSAPAVEEHWTTPPPHGIGSRRHAVTSMMRMRSQNDAEVTGYDPNRSWTMKSISGLLRLFEPMVTSLFGRQFAKDLAHLKELMESGAL